MKLKKFLQQIPPLSPKEWEATADLFVKEEISKGEYYIREGQYCNKVSFIESGLVQL